MVGAIYYRIYVNQSPGSHELTLPQSPKLQHKKDNWKAEQTKPNFVKLSPIAHTNIVK